MIMYELPTQASKHRVHRYNNNKQARMIETREPKHWLSDAILFVFHTSLTSFQKYFIKYYFQTKQKWNKISIERESSSELPILKENIEPKQQPLQPRQK